MTDGGGPDAPGAGQTLPAALADGPGYALASSGGKDSTLALHRARTRGLGVTHLLCVVDGESGRIPYHGVRGEMMAAQADALGLELVREEADASEGPGRGFETAFLRGLDRLVDAGVHGLVFGNIHLEDIRAWYEERVTGRGLEHVEPLWEGEPARLVREFVGLGYRASVVSVMLGEGDTRWLGRDIDAGLLGEISSREAMDPCGERGEFHSFVWDGPLFRRPVDCSRGETMEVEGHRFVDLLPDTRECWAEGA